MSFEHLPGAVVVLLNGDYKPAGDVVIENYLHHERCYNVWWTYEQTGESELIKVPEWRLTRKKETLASKVIR